MSYEKHTWTSGEVITAAKMNNIEDGITKTATVVIDNTEWNNSIDNIFAALCIEEEHGGSTHWNIYYSIGSDYSSNPGIGYIQIPMFGYSNEYIVCIAFDTWNAHNANIETSGNITKSEILGSVWDGSYWSSAFYYIFIVNGDGVIKISDLESNDDGGGGVK